MLHFRGAACLSNVLLLVGMAGMSVWAQVPPKKDAPPISALRLPSGAIIVVAKGIDAIDKPDAIYLSPEKFKELTEQIEALRKQLAAEKAAPPGGKCELEARLEKRGLQTVVKLRASFEFRTLAPRSVILLGCQKAQPVDAKLDDKLPLLFAGEKGLSVLVETADKHQLQLDLELPLQPRGNEVGFEIGLPGVPITLLSMEAPKGVDKLVLSRRKAGAPASSPEPPLEVTRVAAKDLAPGQAKEALGPVSYLLVTWEAPGAANTTAAALSAEAEILVNVSETDIQTEARLRLKGSAKRWRFLAPSNAEVTVGRAPAAGTSWAAAKPLEFPPDQGYDEIVRPDPGKSEWVIKFRDANSSELLVVIGVRTPRTKGRTAWPVGPFAVLGVPRQEGTIRVRSSAHVRATGNVKGDTKRVDAADDPNAEAVYRYRSLPAGGKDQFLTPLELDVRAVAGVVQTRVHHYLTLDGAWRLRSVITVTPIRMDVEALDVDVPADGAFQATPPQLVEGVVRVRDEGAKRSIVQIKFAAPQRGEFTFTLEGAYPLPTGAQEMTLALPRLLNVLDRAGQVTVTAPEGFDLRGSAFQWDNDKPGARLYPLEPVAGTDRAYSASVSRGLAQVDLAWRPIRADVRVEASTDVTLGDRQAQYAQQLHCYFADVPLRRLRLHGPATATNLAVSVGNKLENTGPGEWSVALPADAGKEAAVTLTWSGPLPAAEEGARLAVPLFWVDGATSCESRVRFVRDRDAAGHFVPALASGPWQELPMELLPAGASLLVVRGSGQDLSLTVSLHDAENTGPALPQAWIDRALIQAQAADGAQRYRARFHLTRWQARSLDLELPATAADIELLINGLRAPREASADGDSGRILRVPLPAWRERQKLLVDLRYSLPGGSEGAVGALARWQPPRPHGRYVVRAVRWQIALPSQAIPLSIGDAVVEEMWTVRNAHVQLVPAYGTNELDQWIASGQEPVAGESGGWEMKSAGLTARQAGLTPMRLVVVQRTAWYASISLIVLATGLLLSRLPQRAVGAILALLVPAVVIVGFIWPQPTGQALMAAQPGLAILACIIILQRFLHWRYRRQLARLPGFSRIQAESALSRSNGKRPSRETSTIDVPAG
jgi:hypothetical protein